MMVEFKAPQQIPTRSKTSIFLAGTIDMGNSENWQHGVKEALINEDVDVYNPRRSSWDESWTQNYDNPQFYQQVMWELNALEKADIIVLNLLSDSKSPISLLELGIFAKSGKLLVCCPKQFYRSGNVEIVCDKYNIPLFRDIESLIQNLRNELQN